eukprot:scaffold70164_cov33-Tisochrysis_lutea.AAC.3
MAHLELSHIRRNVTYYPPPGHHRDIALIPRPLPPFRSPCPMCCACPRYSQVWLPRWCGISRGCLDNGTAPG